MHTLKVRIFVIKNARSCSTKSSHKYVTPEIGFIGLGEMGFRMANNLVKAGKKIVIYDKVQAPIDLLVKEGAIEARSPKEVFDKKERKFHREISSQLQKHRVDFKSLIFTGLCFWSSYSYHYVTFLSSCAISLPFWRRLNHCWCQTWSSIISEFFSLVFAYLNLNGIGSNRKYKLLPLGTFTPLGIVPNLFLFFSFLYHQLFILQLYIDSSTIDPEVARSVQRTLLERGIHMIDAPVSGGVNGIFFLQFKEFIRERERGICYIFLIFYFFDFLIFRFFFFCNRKSFQSKN